MRNRLMRMIVLAPLILVLLLLFVALGGAIVRLLWNWLLPTLFDWPEISFWQALGILALCRILFGGWGGYGSGRSGIRRRLEERCCERMSPEERERFRQRLRERWEFDPAEHES